MIFGFIGQQISPSAKIVQVYWVNYQGVAVNPSSGTLKVVVKRLVTS